MADLTRKTGDHNTLRITKKMLQRLHGNIMFSLENLGLWGSLQVHYHDVPNDVIFFMYCIILYVVPYNVYAYLFVIASICFKSHAEAIENFDMKALTLSCATFQRQVVSFRRVITMSKMKGQMQKRVLPITPYVTDT